MELRLNVEFSTGRIVSGAWDEVSQDKLDEIIKEFFQKDGNMFEEGIKNLAKFNLWGFVTDEGKIPYMALNSQHVTCFWIETRENL